MMFYITLVYNQIIICQEIIGSQPSVLCTNSSVSKNRFSACVIVQVRYEKKHFRDLTTTFIYIYEIVFLIYNCFFSLYCSILVTCLLRLAPQCLHFD